MRRSAWRLAVALVLFAAWIGYLAFLAATTTKPIVLARPQFLTADLIVVAELGSSRFWPEYPVLVAAAAGGPATAMLLSAKPAPINGPGEIVTVKRHVWSAKAADAKRETIYVRNLSKCGPALGWEGPGEYLLALSKTEDGVDVFQVTPFPRTPGFSGMSADRAEILDTKSKTRMIYPATALVLRQMELLVADLHR